MEGARVCNKDPHISWCLHELNKQEAKGQGSPLSPKGRVESKSKEANKGLIETMRHMTVSAEGPQTTAPALYLAVLFGSWDPTP